MAAIAVYVTCKNMPEAKRIARLLLRKKLIACANLMPATSLYAWKGKMKESRETALLMKSQKELFVKLSKEIKKAHSYELPCIIFWYIGGDHEYLAWIKKTTSP